MKKRSKLIIGFLATFAGLLIALVAILPSILANPHELQVFNLKPNPVLGIRSVETSATSPTTSLITDKLSGTWVGNDLELLIKNDNNYLRLRLDQSVGITPLQAIALPLQKLTKYKGGELVLDSAQRNLWIVTDNIPNLLLPGEVMSSFYDNTKQTLLYVQKQGQSYSLFASSVNQLNKLYEFETATEIVSGNLNANYVDLYQNEVCLRLTLDTRKLVNIACYFTRHNYGNANFYARTSQMQDVSPNFREQIWRATVTDQKEQLWLQADQDSLAAQVWNTANKVAILWAARNFGPNERIEVYSASNAALETRIDLLPNDQIIEVAVDRHGGVWATVLNNGQDQLMYWNGSNWQPVQLDQCQPGCDLSFSL